MDSLQSYLFISIVLFCLGLYGVMTRRNGRAYTIRGRLRRTHMDDHGRPRIALKRTHRICVLVATAFHGPCPSGLECCHNNGDPSDNQASNLRWDTRESNQADRVDHGTSNRGQRHGCAKLQRLEVLEIRRLYDAGGSPAVLAVRFRVSERNIRKIGERKGWSWLAEVAS